MYLFHENKVSNIFSNPKINNIFFSFDMFRYFKNTKSICFDSYRKYATFSHSLKVSAKCAFIAQSIYQTWLLFFESNPCQNTQSMSTDFLWKRQYKSDILFAAEREWITHQNGGTISYLLSCRCRALSKQMDFMGLWKCFLEIELFA